MILIYSSNTYEGQRLREEAKKLNINVIFENLRDIDFFNFKIPDVSVVYFGSTQKLIFDSRIIAKEFDEHGIRVVDQFLKEGWILTKTRMYWVAKKVGVRIPETTKIYKIGQLNRILKLGFPLVAKYDLAHRGSKVFLIRNENELLKFLEKIKRKIDRWIFQKYIPYDHDLRLLLVGDKFLGTMKRINPNDFRANISRGGYGKPYKAPEEIIEVAFKIKEKLELDIAAVDFLVYKDEYLFIEANKSPQFKGFERYVGKNVAREILLFLKELEKK